MKATNRAIAATMSLLVTALVPASAPAQFGSGINRHSETTDEAYFLIRALELLYEQWPQDVADAGAFATATRDLRKQALQLKVRAERAGVPSEIPKRFADFVSVLDSYTGFLTNLGAIRKGARDTAERENFKSGYRGGYAAGGTFAALKQNDNVSTSEAAVASLIVGGITYALDSWGKSSQRDDAEKAAVRTAAQKIEDASVEALARAKQTACEVADQKGWKRAEMGWDLSEEHARLVSAMLSKGDYAALAREASRQAEMRPRDPFVRLAIYSFQAAADGGNSAFLMHLAEQSLEVRDMIPSDGFYDDYRRGVVGQAAGIALLAREAELHRGNNPATGTRASRLAVTLWSEVLKMKPDDPTGEIRSYLAGARLADGDPRGAAREIEPVIPLRKDDPEFKGQFATILCGIADWDNALRALEEALAAGALDVRQVRREPLLKALDEHRQEAFRKMLTPQWTWMVTDDWLQDDVVMQNNSPYPLTNVRFNVVLHKDARTKKLDLKCEGIQPGKQQKWTNVAEAVKGGWDKTSGAELHCDQSPP